ncbi:MAG: hypothetical protein HOP16_17130 [Acidobacteria bacterium]|nr:hypothetical protein [Acidobacteriota bacterium]
MRLTLMISAALLTVTLAVSSAVLSAGGETPSAGDVTFTKHVAPILQKHCQECHRPSTFAPMSLLTYEQARPWARAMKAKVVARQMPPWFIDKTVGIQDYVSDRSLTEAEIETIAKWADSGAPQGNPADMPPPRVFKNNQQWDFGQFGDEPDMIVSLPKDYMMPPTGPDRWPEIMVDPKLTEDRYLAGVQLIPTKGDRLIHHLQTNMISPSAEAQFEQGNVTAEERGAFLNEYAVGKGADLFADNSGRLIPAGTKFNVQLHLHPTYNQQNREATPVNVMLGLKFHPKGYKPQFDAKTIKIPYAPIDIRPGEKNVRVDGYYRLAQATRVLSWQPHMHNRGSYACLQALIPAQGNMGMGSEGTGLPTAERIEVRLLSCARFSFSWHLNYTYTDDVAPLLPAGTILQTLQWFDNSRGNPDNPDPDAQITRGNRTLDEMAGAWLSYYYLSNAEFEKQMTARESRKHRVNTSN